MKAAVLIAGHTAPGSLLQIEEVPRPEAQAGYVLLRVLACGVCRTDLHIAEGDLPPLLPKLIPGHQIVGEVAGGATAELPLGSRAGVSWIGGVDGECWYCHHGMENLCDQPTFTGYTVNGGYAEYALARADFSFRCLPGWMTSMSLRCCAPGLSAFAACGSQASRRASGWDFLALAARLVWRSPFCNPGSARFMW